jgi:hypothetical protein
VCFLAFSERKKEDLAFAKFARKKRLLASSKKILNAFAYNCTHLILSNLIKKLFIDLLFIIITLCRILQKCILIYYTYDMI